MRKHSLTRKTKETDITGKRRGEGEGRVKGTGWERAGKGRGRSTGDETGAGQVG